ncbi:MAG: 2,3-bisphosphoglycerate-independent phosphoglycerate mutase [Rhodospirillaceae bacterium]|jgi:2,3-bisphosphoglycerate-independent phosphoglycerate mutase|nr:2,3-bisphosphoglycerate-independent phosphoglycerate mutase [Rhodospirillaceae bacterium]MBT7769609.1 2,3-bisphosphoglycerate-independent phosphoglycerate mutase [Rhodospirillales bacterium]MBT4701034.1 2,3-bisphosphoglycerate-independent phosphoglycerate mutase [Rhodospirillaceae bacterium]MBT5033629.1 2,3-bisphosphoglycerate-independent phosphoglycerate mutase [Rhodospirillaceae bacterium]MBT6221508.1 2,3-bisphosphoglycerate-independent phosphoglycerate mutase [Rhodospirillaceae bacterium]
METSSQDRPKPVVLCILDGWGDRAAAADNAVSLGKTPNWDRMVAELPRAQLLTSGDEVGLPDGQMGNSEVGHTNLGAGRVVLQDLPKIDQAVADGSLAKKAPLQDLITKLKNSGGTCHLMGLLSPGGVHSHQDHMVSLAKTVAGQGVPVAIHAFLDGRDTPPKSAQGFMETFAANLTETEGVSIATVSGRYYAMDRDTRWDRVSKAFSGLMVGEGETASHPVVAISTSYDADVTDEFMLPTVIGDYAGMKDGDGLLMANFRADRAREILTALVDPDFDGFERTRICNFAARIGLSEYSTDLNRFFETLFPPLALENILGQIVADAGLKQLRIAETEKYAHVTFFFNGGREEVFPGEERILVPSPDVATYDLKPEMSAGEVTDKLTAAIEDGRFDLIIVNYANGDMVGHTGMIDAAVRAAETLDTCLGRVGESVEKAGGVMMITADHGNCEMMIDPKTGEPHTAHTVNPVPLVMVGAPDWVHRIENGRLADMAPTLLRLLGLPQPAEMTGRSLIVEDGTQVAAAQ